MRRNLFTMLMCILSLRTLYAQSCDCAHFPIKPTSCTNVCKAALLQRSSKQELTDKVKLDPTTAATVIGNRDAHNVKSLSTLKKEIPASDFKEITSKLDSLKAKDAVALAKKHDYEKVDVKEDGKITIRDSAQAEKIAH